MVNRSLVQVLFLLHLLISLKMQGQTSTPDGFVTAELAKPRSMHQEGLPVSKTLEAIPESNPQTLAKIALGEKLFFDTRLSADGAIACSTCHEPAHAFTDRRPASIGIKGGVGQRNSPTILNALYNKTQFWDGRVKTLEDQAQLPILNPIEMGQATINAAVAAIAATTEYRDAFQAAFGHEPNGPDLVRAIASYERTLLSFDSPFDHFIGGSPAAISDSAIRGWALFNTRGRCNKCHAVSEDRLDVALFTDNDFHNIGIGIVNRDVDALACQAEKMMDSVNSDSVDQKAIGTEMSALGRFLVTRREQDIAAFKTPGLRNVLVTAPYFHDGSAATLWDVLDHYNKGGGMHNPYLDEDIQPLALSESEIDDLVAFLASLTSPQYRFLGAKELERQRALSKTNRPQRDVARAFGPKVSQPQPSRHCQ
jgi:cytochrome c peroxidase